jgi:lysophospholipase L1-like esterase
VLLSIFVLAGATPASSAGAVRPLHLSLGDSWAFGIGATAPAETGYVPVLHTALRERFDCPPAGSDTRRRGCRRLQLTNLAVGGATTPSLIQSQLPRARSILESRNGDRDPFNDVVVVTLHIGGNDVVGPIIGACLGALTPSCFATIQAEFTAYRRDLEVALSTLRAAAGPDTRIVIGTYDNPIPTCFLAAFPTALELAPVVLEGGPGVPQGLHDVMREVAAAHGVEVAEVFGDLGPQDWVGGSDCLHPDDSGHAKVAAAFVEVLAPS